MYIAHVHSAYNVTCCFFFRLLKSFETILSFVSQQEKNITEPFPTLVIATQNVGYLCEL